MNEKKITVTIKVKSPLHLSSGRADVNVDTDVVHDKLGLPYFPARRFKGLLYESALEVAEMMEASKLGIVKKEQVEELFRHKANSPAGLVIQDFHLPNYEQVAHEWACLLLEFGKLIQPEDVLEAYTSLRTQTALNEDGTAKDHSLRTIRVLDLDDVSFTGEILLRGGEEHLRILAFALQNMTRAGGHRHRGFGKIECAMDRQAEIIESCLRQVN